MADLRSRGRRESEVELLRKDGSTFLAEVHSSALRDNGGVLIGYVGTYRDVTALRNEANERQRRLTELSRLRDELIEAERTKERLIDNISHELRTPLTTVAAYIDMFESGNMGELTAAQEHAVEVVQHNVGRLDELVAEMLDSVRMDSGRMVIHHRPLDLCRALDRCVDYIAPQAKAAMMTIEFHEPGDPVFVDGDEGQLTRVFTNLLVNAVKFNVSGGRIDVSVYDHSHGLAVVTVRDTGIGISKDAHDKIFDRFYQVAKPGQRAYGGTGLGLTIARQIVELHEGYVSVKSEPGKGSEFKVVLPTTISRMEHDDHDHCDEAVELSADDNGGTSGNILIIEDDEELLEMLLTGFSNHGFKVSGACTGAEGIRAAQTELPDIVVLDLALPDTDGVEVCRSLREASTLADIPILGITAWPNREDLDRFAEAGAYKIVSKPFVFRDVLREVVQTVGQHTER
jgi:signal transduction histidine kinase/CheY-like chemotaxis protein